MSPSRSNSYSSYRSRKRQRSRSRDRRRPREHSTSRRSSAPRPSTSSSDAAERTCFVTQLQVKATEDDVRTFFKRAGCDVVGVHLLRSGGRSRGMGYVEFSTRHDVGKATLLNSSKFVWYDEGGNSREGFPLKVEGPRKGTQTAAEVAAAAAAAATAAAETETTPQVSKQRPVDRALEAQRRRLYGEDGARKTTTTTTTTTTRESKNRGEQGGPSLEELREREYGPDAYARVPLRLASHLSSFDVGRRDILDEMDDVKRFIPTFPNGLVLDIDKAAAIEYGAPPGAYLERPNGERVRGTSHLKVYNVHPKLEKKHVRALLAPFGVLRSFSLIDSSKKPKESRIGEIAEASRLEVDFVSARSALLAYTKLHGFELLTLNLDVVLGETKQIRADTSILERKLLEKKSKLERT